MVVNKDDDDTGRVRVRGVPLRSLYDRVLKGEVSLPTEKVLAAKLPEPYFDPTTKVRGKGRAITEAEIVREGRMTSSEMREVKDSTLSIYAKMGERAIQHGFILADSSWSSEGGTGTCSSATRSDGRVQDVARGQVRNRQDPGQLRQAAGARLADLRRLQGEARPGPEERRADAGATPVTCRAHLARER